MDQRRDLPVILFAAAIFSGAFLIFLVQSVLGKLILPWFGDGPGVWTVCLMFYQAALFLGYLYAYGSVRLLAPRVQWLTHAGVFGGSMLLLPVTPGEHWRPEGLDGDPSFAILIMLLSTVALPFVALSATRPLLQAWFARRYPDRSPYPLYAVSNLGSFVALFCFPCWSSPSCRCERSAGSGPRGFVAAAILILAAGFLATRTASGESPTGSAVGEVNARPLPSGHRALWLLLPACAVMLLMAVTNKLCLDLASFPFLWILPLGLYLASFILCFASERFYRRSLWLGIALGVLALEYGVVLWVPQPGRASTIFWLISVQVPLLCGILFLLCMLIHGELYRLRPPAPLLTSSLPGRVVGRCAGRTLRGVDRSANHRGLLRIATRVCADLGVSRIPLRERSREPTPSGTGPLAPFPRDRLQPGGLCLDGSGNERRARGPDP